MTASVEEWKRRYETARLAYEETRTEINRLHALLDGDAAEIMRLIREIERLRIELADVRADAALLRAEHYRIMNMSD